MEPGKGDLVWLMPGRRRRTVINISNRLPKTRFERDFERLNIHKTAQFEGLRKSNIPK